MTDRQIDRGIQILRIVSCFAVFFCHFGQRLHINELSKNLYNFSSLGRFGVQLFFVISGYLACFSLAHAKSIVQFYKKRAFRILPLYYFSILYFFLTESIVFRHIPKDAMHLGWLRYIFCLNGIVPSEGYFWCNIGITWTIPVFVLFYILAPLIVKVAKSTLSSTLVLIASIGVSYIINAYARGWFSAFSYMPCFIIGILVYNAKKENLIFITTAGLQLFVFITQNGEWQGYISKIIINSELFVISAIFATIVLVTDNFALNSKRITRILDILDEHSYTLYLVHGITFCGIIDKFDINEFNSSITAVVFRLFISIVLTAILTIVIHRYYEKPIQKKLSDRFLSYVC